MTFSCEKISIGILHTKKAHAMSSIRDCLFSLITHVDNDVLADARDSRLALVVHGPPRPQRRPHFRSTRSGGFRVFSPSVRQRNFFSGAIRGALNHGGRVYFGR